MNQPPSHTENTPTSATRLFADLLALVQDAPDWSGSTADLEVTVDVDGAVHLALGSTADERASLVVRADETTAVEADLARLVKVGTLAAQARSAVRAHHARVVQDTEATRRAQNVARYALGTATAQTFGLQVADDGTWVVPGVSLQHAVRQVEPEREAWMTPYAATLEVTVDGQVLGYVHLTAEDHVVVLGRHERTLLDEHVLGRVRVRELTRARPPFRTGAVGANAPVLDQVRDLIAAAPGAAAWVAQMEAAVAQVEATHAAWEAERVEWLRLSRSKDRIPNGPLNAWMRENSHLQHQANGLAVGGWKVIAEPVVGRSRPAHMDRRRKPEGLAQVLHVVRLVHANHAGYRDVDFHTFYGHAIDKLREVLPGCVVKVPEDRKAVFVAVDKPEYVEALEAAVVEWVLLGADG